MLKPVIVALDVSTDTEAVKFVDILSEYVDIFKIGPVLFYKYGARIINEIQKRNKKIFLDVKLYDIPNTVELAVKTITGLGVYSVSVHLSGGEEMMERILSLPKRPLIWGVSVLTSFNDGQLQKLGISGGTETQVERLVNMGLSKSIDGIVSSAHELPIISELKKQYAGKKEVSCIVPGIRPENSAEISGDDQRRTMTPAEALKLGAHYLVIGRPILQSKDPAGLVKSIVENKMQPVRRNWRM